SVNPNVDVGSWPVTTSITGLDFQRSLPYFLEKSTRTPDAWKFSPVILVVTGQLPTSTFGLTLVAWWRSIASPPPMETGGGAAGGFGVANASVRDHVPVVVPS